MNCKYCKADCCRRGEHREKECRGYIPMTNAERIRAMSDAELAELLLNGCTGTLCEDQPQNEYGSVDCFACRMKWLRQTAK